MSAPVRVRWMWNLCGSIWSSSGYDDIRDTEQCWRLCIVRWCGITWPEFPNLNSEQFSKCVVPPEMAQYQTRPEGVHRADSAPCGFISYVQGRYRTRCHWRIRPSSRQDGERLLQPLGYTSDDDDLLTSCTSVYWIIIRFVSSNNGIISRTVLFI